MYVDLGYTIYTKDVDKANRSQPLDGQINQIIQITIRSEKVIVKKSQHLFFILTKLSMAATSRRGYLE